MSDQNNERLLRGPKGDQGAQGHQGTPGMSRGARLGFVYLAVVTLVLAAANLLFTSQEVTQVRGAVLAECRFNADLGSAPVAVNPKTGKASLLGVSIVSDARVAWQQLGCTGRLMPPQPSFVRWAKAYHLPVS